MRLAHHLIRHPSGIWHFRLIVPRPLHVALGLKVLKRSLRTRDPVVARRWAYALGARYAEIFASALQDVSVNKRWDDAAVRRVVENMERHGGIRKWELKTSSDGFELKTDGSADDHDRGMEALRALLGARLAASAPFPAASVPVAAPAGPRLSIDEAINDYQGVEAPLLKPNTWSQRKRALSNFSAAMGGHTQVVAVTRQFASRWSDGLLRAGKSKRTAANEVSHVAQLFDALLRKEVINVNPIKGLLAKSGSKTLRHLLATFCGRADA